MKRAMSKTYPHKGMIIGEFHLTTKYDPDMFNNDAPYPDEKNGLLYASVLAPPTGDIPSQPVIGFKITLK